MKRPIVGTILLILIALQPHAQSPAGGITDPAEKPPIPGLTAPEGDQDPATIAPPDDAPPVPQWARNLRRAEIVATGSFPLTLLVSRLTYSLIRFAVKSIQAGAIDPTYAPWFLAPPGSPELSMVEKLSVIGGAVSLSSIIAFIDYRLGIAETRAGP